MDTGLLLALIASVVFAAGIVLARKTAGEAGEAFSLTSITVFTGIPLFAIAITASGGWHCLAAISGKALGMLAAVGILHFLIGRTVAYDAFRLIGANRASPITQISPAFTVILSWIFLDESLTLYILFGAACMIAGIFLITQEKGKNYGGEKKRPPQETKGILLSLVAALCWGITPVLIRPAVQEVGSSVVGSFTAYTTAGLIMALILLVNKTRRANIARLAWKKNIFPMVVSGLFTATGQLLYFNALGRSQANTVAPLVSIEIVFIFILSFIINRKSEVFSLKVALGMAAAVAGTFLLFQ
jgi:drug/metabolite transporter (DMT)-like permease